MNECPHCGKPQFSAGVTTCHVCGQDVRYLDYNGGRLERVRLYDRVSYPDQCVLCDSKERVGRERIDVEASPPAEEVTFSPFLRIFQFFIRRSEKKENRMEISVPICDACSKESITNTFISPDERWVEIFATPSFCDLADPRRKRGLRVDST